MQKLIVIVNQVGRILGVLDELLESVLGEELPIGFGDPPVELTKELTRLCLGKEMDLAREYVKQRVLA